MRRLLIYVCRGLVVRGHLYLRVPGGEYLLWDVVNATRVQRDRDKVATTAAVLFTNKLV